MLPRLYFIALALVACVGSCLATTPAGGNHHHHHHHQGHVRKWRKPKGPNANFTKGRAGDEFLNGVGENMVNLCPDKAAPIARESQVRLYLFGANALWPALRIMEQHRTRSWRDQDIGRLVTSRGFSLSLPTLIYMGGWRQDKQGKWLRVARRVNSEIIATNNKTSKFNLLIFDFVEYTNLLYFPSAAQVPHLGNVLADFIEQLIRRHGYKADKIHLISYSLSTHIAGVAGHQVQQRKLGKLSQITALDPTAVCFNAPLTKAQFGNSYALKASDAKLVVARHYDMDLYGSRKLLGGLDIVLNGGLTQPNTIRLQNDHQRTAVHEEFMSMSWKQEKCSDVAYECENYEKFFKGQCADCGENNESCLMIGTLANAAQGQMLADKDLKPGTKMFLNTGFNMLCAHHYQVVAKLRENPTKEIVEKFTKGQVQYQLGPKFKVQPMYKLEGESDEVSFTSLLVIDQNVADLPQQLDEKSPEVLGALESISFNYMSSTSPETRANKTVRFCPGPSNSPKLIRCTENPSEETE